jgi:hypothetical protein
VEAWIGGLIGVAGTLLGAWVGFRGALEVSRERRDEDRWRERRQTLANYVGLSYYVVGLFRGMPPNPPKGMVAELIESLGGEAATWVREQRGIRKTFGDHFGQAQLQLTTAVAQVQLLKLSPQVREAVDRTNTYLLRLTEERSDEVKAEWPEIYTQLHKALGEVATEPEPDEGNRWFRVLFRPAGRQ